jgi:hypothetical protein
MDDAVRDYIDAIAPEQRPLFDRLHRLVLEVHPDAAAIPDDEFRELLRATLDG